MRLRDKRVLVIGASSGLGKAAAIEVAKEGARVVVAARRVDRLAETVADCAGDAEALACDVTQEADCHRVVDEAVAALGGLDALVYAPGIATFGPIEEIDGAEWHRVLATNVVGLSLVLNKAIAPLTESRGRCVVLSSISIDDSPPRPQQATYPLSKHALEILIESWQNEHRAVGFTSIACGDTLSEFGHGLDPERIIPIVQRWAELGYLYGRMMEPVDVAEQVVNALAARETLRRIAITPGFPESRGESAFDYGGEAAVAMNRSQGS